MGNQTPTGNVRFVNATVTNSGAPKDAAVRALIRKQAMRKAADTRCRGGNFGKHNLRQYPVTVAANDVVDALELARRCSKEQELSERT